MEAKKKYLTKFISNNLLSCSSRAIVIYCYGYIVYIKADLNLSKYNNFDLPKFENLLVTGCSL